MPRKPDSAMPSIPPLKQDWTKTERCAFCECPVYEHKDGYAITPVFGAEHLCGINCACRDSAEEQTL